MNHAFILLVHKEPELFGRIIHRLAAPNHYFIVNVDKKFDDAPFRRITSDIRNIYFLNGCERCETNWGGYSLVDCTIRLLKKAIERDNIDYIHLISGQDYPIVNNNDFDAFFEKHNGESFMLYDKPEEHIEWSKPRGKYEQRYMPYHFNDNHLPIIFEKLIHAVEHFHYLRKPISYSK